VDVAKGHEGQNDFVLLVDLPAALGDLDRELVTALCDRRRGVGGDGLLRVTVAGSAREAGVLDEFPPGATEDDWYIDHRRADGSLAEASCDGVRVFAHYLWAAGLERRKTFVVTTFGTVWIANLHDVNADFAEVSIEGAPPWVEEAPPTIETKRGLRVCAGDSYVVHMESVLGESDPNASCLVVATPEPETVSVRRFLNGAPTRYVGACASSAAAAAVFHETGRHRGTVTVHAPGEELMVSLTEDEITMRGPSTLVTQGHVTDRWLRSNHQTMT
jgi:diaminopimelate epimerase